MHVTVAAIKGMGTRGRDLRIRSHTGQRLSMATAVFNALKLAKPCELSFAMTALPYTYIGKLVYMWQ